MKKIFLFFLLFFPLIINAEDCWNIGNLGINNRTNGHQDQCRPVPGISASGNPSSSCISITSGNSSIVTFSGSCFYSKGHGSTTAHISVPAYCTCSHTAVNADFSVSLYEWGFSSINVDNYDISPKFEDKYHDYNVTVKSSSITLRLKVHDVDSGTNVTVNGTSVTSPDTSKERAYQITNLQSGNNTVKIVTNSHGRIDTYTLTVNLDKPKEVSKIYFDEENITLSKGTSKQINFNVEPKEADTSSVVWKSTYPEVATVSNGFITAVAPGTTTISATINGKTATLNLRVIVNATSISLNPKLVQIKKGDDIKLSYKIEPSNASNRKVVFSSSDEDIAIVDSMGNVTGINAGRAIVTVKTVDGNLVDECVVDVAQIVEKINLSQDYIYIFLGESKKIDYTVLPSNVKNPYLNWIIYDNNVIDINNGTIIAKNEGKTEVIAKSGSVLSKPLMVEVLNGNFEDPPDEPIETKKDYTILYVILVVLALGGLGYLAYRYKRKENNEE